MDAGDAPPHEAIAPVGPSISYTLAVGLGLPMGLLVLVFLCVRKCLFFLTWRSFRDGPYVVGQHQWRPGNLTGPRWCNVCQAVVYGIRSYVVTCDICGMYAHAQCAASTMHAKSAELVSVPLAATAGSSSHLVVSRSCRVPGVVLPSRSTALDGKKDAARSPVSTLQSQSDPLQHMWIKGNVDPMDLCSLCGLFCGSILAFYGLKCAWCHVRVHEECFQQALARANRPPLLRRCNLNQHASLIVPPSCVVLHGPVSTVSKSQRVLNSVCGVAHTAVTKVSRLRLRRGIAHHSVIESPTAQASKLPNEVATGWRCTSFAAASNVMCGSDGLPFELVETPEDTTPLLVFVNSRSGGKLGLHVLRQARKWLNPVQVYDLSHQSPIEPLRRFVGLPRLRVLVCGGDGTVGWVLSALDEIGSARQPPIAIVPLGTGNDLARVLGWGAGFSAPTDVSDILSEVQAAHISLLDRWKVSVGDLEKCVVMNNYMGVGVDAQVALEFHEQRERSPELFMSQFVNKLWYSQFGAKNFLVRTCAGLSDKVVLVCDGKRIALPDGTEGIIFLNINSYGGGSKLWHDDAESDVECSDSDSETNDDDQSRTSSVGGTDANTHFGSSSPHDNLLDIVAVYGTLHLGQMQVGLSKAVRLCQAKAVSLTLKESLPVQIDGEPWQQGRTTMKISFLQQAFMLSRTVDERDVVTKQVGEVLDWAEHTHVITSRQHDTLLVEIARRVVKTAASRRRTSSSSRALLSPIGDEMQFVSNC
uniref:Diacylglycerol kinase n=1 Tax=Peronospora matthiolae TaxID=2874970 RepID=A0AAV1UC77_9STRA